jgi:hypothetical protein
MTSKVARKEALPPNETRLDTAEIRWNPGQYVSFSRVPDGTPTSQQSHTEKLGVRTTRQTDSNSDTFPFALIILNQPIEMPVERFSNLWEQCTPSSGLCSLAADIVICADGGANRLYIFSEETGSWFVRTSRLFNL